MREKYIITFEDGQHYLASVVTADDQRALNEGLLTVIRCSDGKELSDDGQWYDLKRWGKEPENIPRGMDINSEPGTTINKKSMEWISVKERLPDLTGNLKELNERASSFQISLSSVEVIIKLDRWAKPKTGFLCQKDDPQGETYWEVIGIGGARIDEVTHWMLLPEPPKF